MNNQAVVVCDPGADDMLALMVMAGLGQPPRAVIGTAGNGDVDMGFRNVAGIVGLLGLDVPVGRGSPTALAGAYPDTSPFYGPDGLGGVADALPPAGDPHPDAMSLVTGTVLAIGPLTVVAEALRAGCVVSDVVWMGGSLAAGNMSAVAEFNAWLDPEAADLVLSSGIDVALIPLDVTTLVALIEPDLARMALGQFAELVPRQPTFALFGWVG